MTTEIRTEVDQYAPREVDRYALNDFFTSFLAAHGWDARSDGDSDALNDAVHIAGDALDALLNAPHVSDEDDMLD